jgi:hypothetical protein
MFYAHLALKVWTAAGRMTKVFANSNVNSPDHRVGDTTILASLVTPCSAI